MCYNEQNELILSTLYLSGDNVCGITEEEAENGQNEKMLATGGLILLCIGILMIIRAVIVTIFLRNERQYGGRKSEEKHNAVF